MSGRVGSITTGIVSDGLVFNMDAANRASYPRTGTNVNDTVSQTIGSLRGGVGFEDVNFGIFDFDGTDEDILISSNFGNGYSAITLSSWIKVDVFQTSIEAIFGKDDNPRASGNFYFGIQKGSSTSSGNLRFLLLAPSQDALNTSSNSLNINTWYNIVCTWDSDNMVIYLNGILSANSSTTNATGTLGSLSDPFYIGQSGYSEASGRFDGSIGPSHIYNRALSSTEVLHNYNALKGRFGL